MATTDHKPIHTAPILPGEEETLASLIAQEPSVGGFVAATGLKPLARKMEGERMVVCDLDAHGVQGCADLRAMQAREELATEIVAIGILLFVAAMVGGLAVAFVHLLTKLAKPIGRHRVYALFPKRSRSHDRAPALPLEKHA